MKKLMILLALFVGLSLQAQDTLYYYNGQSLVDNDSFLVAASGGGGGYTVLDTLGFYTLSGTAYSYTNSLRLTLVTAGASGYVDSIMMYQETEAEADSVVVCIYADDEGSPGALLGQGIAEQANQGTATTMRYALTESVSITNTESYWIGIQDLNVQVTAGSGGSRYYQTSNWGTALPDPASGGSQSAAIAYQFSAFVKLDN